MASTLRKMERAISKVFEPPQVDGYIIITDCYASSSINCCYGFPIVIKIKEPDKAHPDIPRRLSSVTFSSNVKALKPIEPQEKHHSPVTFSSRTHSQH